MITITIPKELARKGELVIISRKEYEEFLRVSKKKGYSQLDKDLDEAIREVKKGKIVGPFSSVRVLRQSLEK